MATCSASVSKRQCIATNFSTTRVGLFKSGFLCITFINVKPNVRWKSDLLIFFFSSCLLSRKSSSLYNVWVTSELLLGTLLVCERIKPLCAYHSLHPTLDLIFPPYTQVLYHQLTAVELLLIYCQLAKGE